MLQVPGATSYMGCIGYDDFGQRMQKTAEQDGVNVSQAALSTCLLIVPARAAVLACSAEL